MTNLARSCAMRAAILALLLTATCTGDGGNSAGAGANPLPKVRRIYVPANIPKDQWPPGDWEPFPLAELERRLVDSERQTDPDQSTTLVRAEYRATLVDDALVGHRLEWVPRPGRSSEAFVPLEPLNLSVSDLNWVGSNDGKPLQSVVWGTSPSQNSGLLLQIPGAHAVGKWSLAGRRLARSIEFEIRLPPATVSRLVFDAPQGLVLSTTAGEVSGPRPLESGSNRWELHLGSRTSCRLRFSPPVIEAAQQSLVTTSTRINYVVRTEVLNVVAEFDLDFHESTVRELRMRIDERFSVTDIDYGDDGELAWRVVEGSGGREIAIQLPDDLTDANQTLRVRGMALVPLEPWHIPRIELVGAVESDFQLTVRMHPPYLAADLRLDGFRQIELGVSSSEGETVTLRRLRPDATMLVVPAKPRLAGVCRSVSLARLEGMEWSLTTSLEFEATAGSAFKLSCRIPAGWEIVTVQNDADSSAGDLGGWEVRSTESMGDFLDLSFLTALGPTRPQRVRVTARRHAVLPEESGSLPALNGPNEFDVDAVSILVAGDKQRPILKNAAGFELLSFDDLTPAAQGLDFIRALSATSRAGAVVVRTNSIDATSAVELRPLHVAEASRKPSHGLEGRTNPASPAAILTGSDETPISRIPLVALWVDASVQLSGSSPGFDLYRVSAALSGPAGADFRWELPPHVEFIAASVDGRTIERLPDEGRRTLRLPEANAEGTLSVTFDYRVASHRSFGPNAFQLLLPRLELPVLDCRLELRVPRGLQLVAPPTGISCTSSMPHGDSMFGPLARSAGQPSFHPLDGGDWQKFWSVLRGKDDLSAADSDAENSMHRTGRPAPETDWQDADFEVWTGVGLALPDQVELIVWDRTQIEALKWAALSLALLTVVSLRIAAARWHRPLTTLAVAVLMAMLWALPPLYAQICGSVLVGMAMGLLLPERLLRVHHWSGGSDAFSSHRKSTQSFAAVSAGIFVSILPVLRAAQAQDDRTLPIRTSDQPAIAFRERVDILIPVTTDGRPLSDEPVCYAPADFLRKLRQHERHSNTPGYLLSGCSIQGAVANGGQLAVTVRIDAYVLSTAETVSVELPLSNAVLGGADACRVDGRSHPLSLAPGGTGFIVQLPGRDVRPQSVPSPSPVPDPQPAAAELPTPSATEDSLIGAAIAHQIELRLFPQVELEANDAYRARLGIPRLNDTTVEFSSGGVKLPLMVLAASGETPQNLGSGAGSLASVTMRPGPSRELAFRWSRNPPATSTGAVELDSNVTALVDVSGALVTTTYHVDYRVFPGAVDSLEWRLPRGSTVVSVQSPGLSGYVIEPGENGARRLFLEFVTAQSGTVAVTVTLAQPLNPGAREFELSLLDINAVSDPSRHTIVRRYQVGFRPPIDFRLAVAAAGPDLVLKPRPIDEFLKDWPVPGARPQQAVEIVRGGALRLTLQDLQSAPTVNIGSQGRFSKNGLEWTFHAEIAPPAVPPFRYRLRVDPRVRIRHISVEEGGAERLLRWSLLDDLLVLFLSDRASGVQTVRIDATLPIAPPEDLVLPTVRFEDISTRPERVSLFRNADVQVTLLEAGAPPESPSARSALATPEPVSEGILVSTFELVEGHPAPRVRLETVAPAVTAEVACILSHRGDERTLTLGVEFEVKSGRMLRFDIELPDELARYSTLETAASVQTIRLPGPDGRSILAVFPASPVSGAFRVQLSAPLDSPTAKEWTMPAVTLPEVSVNSRYLVAPRGATVDLPAVPPPPWLSELLQRDFSGTPSNCYRVIAEVPSPVIREAPPRNDVAANSLLDSRVDFDATGAAHGRMLLWLPQPAKSELIFDWPSGAEPIAALVDDRPQPLPALIDRTWRLPLPAGTHPRLVWVAWTRGSEPPTGFSGWLHNAAPNLRDLDVTAAVWTTRISSATATLSGVAQTGPEAIEVAWARWQAGLAACEGRTDQGPAPANSWLVPYLQSVARQVNDLLSTTRSALPLAAHHDVEQFRQQSEFLKMTVPLQKDDRSGLFSQALVRTISGNEREFQVSAVHLQKLSQPSMMTGTREFQQFWVINRSVLNWMMGGVIGLTASLIAWKSGGICRFVQQREIVAWTALGFFWWLALQPSVVGVLLIVGALIRALSMTLVRRTEQIAAGTR